MQLGTFVSDIVIQVVPGSSMPSDGVVVKGYSSVNESMITGESASIFKEVFLTRRFDAY